MMLVETTLTLSCLGDERSLEPTAIVRVLQALMMEATAILEDGQEAAMTKTSLIHLARDAIVYVRQSTTFQVALFAPELPEKIEAAAGQGGLSAAACGARGRSPVLRRRSPVSGPGLSISANPMTAPLDNGLVLHY